MKEIACQFGENQRLSGIITRTNNSSCNKALIFLNAGLDTKHGPYRLHVHIARLAAQHGLDSFRFDYGDLGYSQAEKSGNPLQIRTRDEIKAALDYVQSTLHINQFILLGLCSGAEDAFRYANLDSRTKEIIMIDPFSYQIPHSTLLTFLSRIQRRVLRQFRKIRNKPLYQKNPAANEPGLIEYKYMPQQECKHILKHLIQRNVRLHFIYTSGMTYPLSYTSQFWKIFPELKQYNQVTLDYLPTIGHVQMFEDERLHLMQVIEKRLLEHLI